MKTLELELKKKVLIVDAPLDAYDVSVGTHCMNSSNSWNDDFEYWCHLPKLNK